MKSQSATMRSSDASLPCEFSIHSKVSSSFKFSSLSFKSNSLTFVLAPEGPEGSANNPSMTAAGSYRLPVAAQQIRARATSDSSGSMVCTLGGEDPNLMP